MRKKTLIKLFFAVTVLAIIAVLLFWKFRRSQDSDSIISSVRESITSLASESIINSIQNEALTKFRDQFNMKFLDKLSNEISQAGCVIGQRNKEQILIKITKQKDKYKNNNFATLENLVIEQIDFLVSVKDEFGVDGCDDIENLVSQEIVSLRIFLLTTLGGLSDLAFNHSREMVHDFFYIPNNTVNPLQGGPISFPGMEQMPDLTETIWPNGCRSIQYTLNEAFPVEGYILDISNFYANSKLVPLDYDLGLPREFGGIKEGWQKCKAGNYWTQFWKNESDDVINVNIIASENCENSSIIILFITNTQALPILRGAQKRLLEGPSFFQPVFRNTTLR